MCAKGDAQPTWATEHLPLALNPVLAAIGPAAITLCLPCTQIEQPVAVAPWLQLVHLAVLSTCTTNPHVPAKTPSQDPCSPDSMTLPTSAANEDCCSQKTAQPLLCCSTALGSTATHAGGMAGMAASWTAEQHFGGTRPAQAVPLAPQPYTNRSSQACHALLPPHLALPGVARPSAPRMQTWALAAHVDQ